nr:MAG TPA: hypothetical protein [Caudoviricetes sp.]
MQKRILSFLKARLLWREIRDSSDGRVYKLGFSPPIEESSTKGK